MEFSFSVIGLALIVAAWTVQVVYTLVRGRKMNVFFALLQFIGIGFLVADSYTAGLMNTVAYLNVAAAVMALAMVVLVLLKR
ncbi:MAG: hypothetical protein ABIH78_02670 [Candidatus Peregrinibacteria bacterium]